MSSLHDKTEPWNTLFRAWLHDPVDKPWDIKRHEERAKRYASIFLDEEIHDISQLKGADFEDPLASQYERLPQPDAKGRYQEVGVSPENGRLTVIHPLSGKASVINHELNEDEVLDKIRELMSGCDSMRSRFLTTWRNAPAIFGQKLPAETRNPDHTLWQHLDTTAAIAWAVKSGNGGVALLSFKLGPVQPFIEASRSLRDLLTSSYILSWLTFRALEPIMKECGPTALVFPNLRGVPLVDHWLREHAAKAPRPEARALARPSLPHRFLAIVPASRQEEFKKSVLDSAQGAWRELANEVRSYINAIVGERYPGWDRLWEPQVKSYFHFQVCSYAQADFKPEELFIGERVKSLQALSELGEQQLDNQQPGPFPGFWQLAVEASALLMEADSAVRHIPDYHPEGDVPPKCTLFGTYEQMGPATLSESAAFWSDLNKDREKLGDRRCAIGLIKQFAFDAYFKSKFGFSDKDTRFQSTRDVCNRNKKKDLRYYAVLAMDGDEMGKWLSGDKSPAVREVLDQKLVKYHETKGRRSLLDMRRPVSPALHAAISEALTRYATAHVPEIVEGEIYEGQVIYAGGDDVLAILPLHHALECAQRLRECFSSDAVLGERATASAGLVVAHEKEDLRYVLQAARQAEKRAKHAGRNRLVLGILRRSGEHAFASMPWEYVSELIKQQAAFEKVSDRWTYKLRSEWNILQVLPEEAWPGEMRRLLEHSDDSLANTKEISEQFNSAWEIYRKLEEKHGGAILCDCKSRRELRRFEHFLTLCQSASFLTRGESEVR